MSEKYDTFYISFYTSADRPLRETLVRKARTAMDGNLLNAAQKKGRLLGAHHFHIFTIIPRRFTIDYGFECQSCDQPIYPGI